MTTLDFVYNLCLTLDFGGAKFDDEGVLAVGEQLEARSPWSKKVSFSASYFFSFSGFLYRYTFITSNSNSL